MHCVKEDISADMRERFEWQDLFQGTIREGKIRPQDSRTVNVNEEYEIPGWCAKFTCTREQLNLAVQRVGISAQAVEAELFRVKHQHLKVLDVP